MNAGGVTLAPLAAQDLPVLARYWNRPVEELRPMQAESEARCYDGRYYEQFIIRADGMVVGLASLYEHDGQTVSDGIEIFPPFRRCGFAAEALNGLIGIIREKGYTRMLAQVRTDNAASLALHEKCGFRRMRAFVNRRGREVCELQRAVGEVEV